jgi:hypothetical protein
MDTSSEEEQLYKRQKLGQGKMASQASAGDNEGDFQSNNMEANDSAVLHGKEEAEGQAGGDDWGAPHTNNTDCNDIAKNGSSAGHNSLSTSTDQQQTNVQDNMQYVTSDLQELQKTLAIIKGQNEERDLQYDLLVQTAIKKEKEMITMRNKILDLEKRSMNKNLCVQNLPEAPSENAANAFKAFLGDKLEPRNYDIELAHRNGPKFDNDARTRPMIVQLAKRGMVENIIKATKSDGEYNKGQIRVSRQVPTELRHVTAKLHHLADFTKKTHPNARVEVKDRAIHINGQKMRPPLTPPVLEKTLTCNPTEIDIMRQVNFYASELIGQKGSTFRAFASPAHCAEDARYAYLAISRFPRVASSSHLISAYLTNNDEYDYFDDGDHGLGRHVFDLMQEKNIQGVIVFLSRDFGGFHLGNDRFSIINKVVNQALSRFNAAMHRNPTLQKPDRLHFNLGEESSEADKVPAWQIYEKEGPESATDLATNLAKEAAYRLPSHPQSKPRYDDPVIQEMYKDIISSYTGARPKDSSASVSSQLNPPQHLTSSQPPPLLQHNMSMMQH